MFVFCEVRTSSTYRKLKLSPLHAVEVNTYVPCEVRTSSTNCDAFGRMPFLLGNGKLNTLPLNPSTNPNPRRHNSRNPPWYVTI
jgi:hypothetical protein